MATTAFCSNVSSVGWGSVAPSLLGPEWGRVMVEAHQKSLPFLSGSGKDLRSILSVFVAFALFLSPCLLQQQLSLVMEQYLQTLAYLRITWAAFENADSSASSRKSNSVGLRWVPETCVFNMLPRNNTLRNPTPLVQGLGHPTGLCCWSLQHNQPLPSFIHSFIHLITHWFICSLIQLFIHLLTLK